ncbi:fructose-bisphosphate aldolase [Bacillus tianshenii]|nr:fructose-bisphosphate aldolase [Bacillus tianshenii]
MKNLWVVLFLSILLLMTSACNNSEKQKIIIEAAVSELSEEEFEYVGTRGLDNPAIEDFRKFTFHVEVEHSPKAKRKVELPTHNSWREAINTIDNKDRYWFGDGYENNDSENFAEYGEEFVFYSKGLNEEEIKKAFSSLVISIHLETEKGESMEREYKVGDIIQFNSNDSPKTVH